jgi:hypothetical protein
MVQHDGQISVARAFTAADWPRLVAEAGDLGGADSYQLVLSIPLLRRRAKSMKKCNAVVIVVVAPVR